MKVLAFLFSVLMSVQALAVYNPSWERPIYKSPFHVTLASNNYKTFTPVSLVLTKRDGASQQFTGVELFDKYGASVAKFTVLSLFPTSDGRLAISAVNQGWNSESRLQLQLVILPGRDSTYAGRAILGQLDNFAAGESMGTLLFDGRLSGVITPY